MRSCRLVLGVVLATGCGTEESSDDPPKPPPVAHDDMFTVGEDSSGQITQTKLLANDENVGSLSYSTSFKIVTQPQHGTWASGYAPLPGYFGPDSFTYSLTSNGQTTVATVTVEVTSDNLPYESALRVDASAAAGVAAGDIDGDGKIDLVIAEEATSSVVVLANRTQAVGQYAVQPFGFEGGHTPVGVIVADVDGDGRLDVVAAAKADGLVVLRNITAAGGPISFAGPVYLATPHAMAVAAADLNADGRLDLAAVDDYDDALVVWLNTGAAGVTAFGPRTEHAAPRDPVQLLVDDANGDGTPDLAVLGRTVGELSIFLNTTAANATTPAFAPRLDRATGTKPSNMLLADLDADGDQEIAVLHDSEALWIYANRNAMPGAPSFEAARVIDLPPNLNTSDRSLIAAVDLDGQGGLDMMLATQGSEPCAFLTNRSVQPGAYQFDVAEAEIGDPGRRKRVTYGAPSGILFAELDGAPPQEIVVTANSGFNGESGVFILYGR